MTVEMQDGPLKGLIHEMTNTRFMPAQIGLPDESGNLHWYKLVPGKKAVFVRTTARYKPSGK